MGRGSKNFALRQIEKIIDMFTSLVKSTDGVYRTNLAVDAFYILCYIVFAFFFLRLTSSMQFDYKDELVFLAFVVSFYEIVVRNIRGCRTFIRERLKAES